MRNAFIAVTIIVVLALALPLGAGDKGKKGGKEKNKAPKVDYQQVDDASKSKGPIVTLRGVHKEVVLHGEPQAPDLDALTAVNSCDVIIDLDGETPTSAVRGMLRTFDTLSSKLVWPAAQFDEKAADAFSGGKSVLVFDFTVASEVSDTFIGLQSDYFPFTSKVARITGAQVTDANLKKLAALRSFSLEIVVDKPLNAKQLGLLKKGYGRVFKNFVVPFKMDAKSLKALADLGGVQITFDLRSEADLKVALASVGKIALKADKGVLVGGPFDEDVAAAISMLENLKLLRIDMKDEVSSQFASLLNRRGKGL